jgi:hypothetical protein
MMMRYVLPLVFVVCANDAHALTTQEKLDCAQVSQEHLVDAAIRDIVNASGAISQRAKGDAHDFLPYRSIAEFKVKNPDCCEVLPNIPGDFDPAVQKLGGRFLKPPRVYAVRMSYFEARKDGDTKVYKTSLISCLGKSGSEYEIIKRMGE